MYREAALHCCVSSLGTTWSLTSELSSTRRACAHTACAHTAKALFDDKDTAENSAMLSILTTLLVVLVLGAGSFTFGQDATAFSGGCACWLGWLAGLASWRAN